MIKIVKTITLMIIIKKQYDNNDYNHNCNSDNSNCNDNNDNHNDENDNNNDNHNNDIDMIISSWSVMFIL